MLNETYIIKIMDHLDNVIDARIAGYEYPTPQKIAETPLLCDKIGPFSDCQARELWVAANLMAKVEKRYTLDIPEALTAEFVTVLVRDGEEEDDGGEPEEEIKEDETMYRVLRVENHQTIAPEVPTTHVACWKTGLRYSFNGDWKITAIDHGQRIVWVVPWAEKRDPACAPHTAEADDGDRYQRFRCGSRERS